MPHIGANQALKRRAAPFAQYVSTTTVEGVEDFGQTPSRRTICAAKKGNGDR
jgi:hypothetical protein